MKRLQTILLWTCGVLLFLVAVLWARSQDSSDVIIFERDQGTGRDLFKQIAIGSSRGRAIFGSLRYESLYVPPTPQAQPTLHWHAKTYSQPVITDTPSGP